MLSETRHGGALTYIVRRPSLCALEQTAAMIVFLHSRGCNMRELMPLADAIDTRRYTYIFPNAPFRSADAEGREHFRWLEPHAFESMDPKNDNRISSAVCGSLSACQAMVDRCLQDVITDAAGAPPLVLCGFSEGGACALRYGLGRPDQVSGVVALSGFLTTEAAEVASLGRGHHAQRIFIAHGSDDPIIPVRLGRECHKTLTKAGYDVTYREHPIRHELSVAEVRGLREWLHTHYA